MPAIVVALTVLMIIGAVVALATPNLLHAVISLGAVGFLLSIVFLFLAAPDLAITQLAVEVITLVLLLRATLPAQSEASKVRRSRWAAVAVVALVGVLLAVSVRMLSEFPAFGEPVMDRFADAPSARYLRDGLQDTGAANIVTAVLLDYRAYDTLGEATILFTAVMGALCVLRRRARREPGEAEEPDEEAPS